MKYGYNNIPFEREAKTYALDLEYLKYRNKHAYKEFE